jgi:hypothetical protein
MWGLCERPDEEDERASAPSSHPRTARYRNDRYENAKVAVKGAHHEGS